jgi:hypothetical protein
VTNELTKIDNGLPLLPNPGRLTPTVITWSPGNAPDVGPLEGGPPPREALGGMLTS